MSSQRITAGIDFGAFSVKAVWAERKGASVRFIRSAELQIPPETQDVVRFIMPWIEKNGLRDVNCAVSFPGAQTVFQPVFLPKGDPRTVMQAADMEVASFNSMSGETMLYDAAESEETPDGVRGVIMALARPSSVRSALREAETYGLRLCALPPSPAALFAGIAASRPATPHAVMFADIGHASTDLAVVKNGKLIFARSFTGGGRQFTETVMKLRGVSAAQADALKKSEGSLDCSSELRDAFAAPASEWTSRLNSARAVYRGVFRDEEYALESVVLCGGGSLLRGFAEFISGKLGLPVSVASDSEGGAAFARARGLAMSGPGSSECPLSLLPQWMRNEIVFRAKKPYWIAAGICASLSLLVFIVSGVRAIARERAAVEAESERIAELRTIDSSIKTVRNESFLIREFGPEIMKMLQSGPLARELVALVAGAISPDDWVTMICDEAAYLPPEIPQDKKPHVKQIRELRAFPSVSSINAPVPQSPGKKQPTAESDETFASFIIEGYTPTPDLVSVKELIGKLRMSSLVKRADVLGDELVLPTALSADDGYSDEMTRSLTKFVVRVEVNRP